MTINSDVDIPSALEKLGKKPEFLNIAPSNPPHNIISWEGGDTRPVSYTHLTLPTNREV